MINLEPINFYAIKGTPDIVEEKTVNVSQKVVYLGFVKTLNVVDKKFAIIKITEIKKTETQIETRIEYTDGNFTYNYDWDLRETYNYIFKNF